MFMPPAGTVYWNSMTCKVIDLTLHKGHSSYF